MEFYCEIDKLIKQINRRRPLLKLGVLAFCWNVLFLNH